MTPFKPLVTIELDQYNKLMEYTKTLEEVSSVQHSPYKNALEEVFNRLSNRPENPLNPYRVGPEGHNQIDPHISISMSNLLINTLKKHGVKLETVNGEIKLSINK